MLAIAGLAVMIWTVKLDWVGRYRLRRSLHACFRRRSGPASLDLGKVGSGFIPHLTQNSPVLYAYFVVGLLGSAMTPYEVYFYSSGGIEDRWSTKDLGLNRANAIAGYSLGGFLSLSLMIVGAAVFLRHGISPEHLGTVALGSEEPLGKIGLLLALIGILFAVGGASIDTVFAGAYNLAQFFGWEWGRYRHPSGAPRFDAHLAHVAGAGACDPADRRRPGHADRVRRDLLRCRPAADLHPDPARRERPQIHGTHRNGTLANTLGTIYLFVIIVIAIAAIPLMLLTNVGQN